MIRVFVLVMFLLPKGGTDVTITKIDGAKHTTKEECVADIEVNGLKELTMYMFIDYEGRYGFMQCEERIEEVK